MHPCSLHRHNRKLREIFIKGSVEQLQKLIRYLIEEYLKGEQDVVNADEALMKFIGKKRELYDQVIETISTRKATGKHKFAKISNIFNDYAGVTSAERASRAPNGTMLKAIGAMNDDGRYQEFPPMLPKPALRKSIDPGRSERSSGVHRN